MITLTPALALQMSGNDLFRQSCHEISTELLFFNEIILDVFDFRKAATFLLKDIASSALQHFKVIQTTLSPLGMN
jgi:hypothetical protein